MSSPTSWSSTPRSISKSLDLRVGEIDGLLDRHGLDQEDDLPEVETGITPVSRLGDLWILGEHRLVCGDALRPESYAQSVGDDKAEMMFADPPYNVPVEGHVSGLGAVKHDNFAMASGELSSAEFQTFLKTSLGHAASRSINGAIHYVCMDWRHQRELIAAGDEVYSELKNLCIWNKSNAGMGSLYRSKHELIFVFKVGKKPHINNVALGKWGRHRTNVWDYVSQNALNGTKKSKLALHPTVKPVAMIADAIRDCSNRGGLILDPFGGAGTTLIAAERTGRRARVIELEPIFVDVTIERWQRLTGGTARSCGERSAICAARQHRGHRHRQGRIGCLGGRPRCRKRRATVAATRSAMAGLRRTVGSDRGNPATPPDAAKASATSRPT